NVPVVFRQNAKAAPTRLRRRDLGIFDPRSVCELKEIVARVRRAVHPAGVKSAALGQRGRIYRQCDRECGYETKISCTHNFAPKNKFGRNKGLIDKILCPLAQFYKTGVNFSATHSLNSTARALRSAFNTGSSPKVTVAVYCGTLNRR